MGLLIWLAGMAFILRGPVLLMALGALGEKTRFYIYRFLSIPCFFLSFFAIVFWVARERILLGYIFHETPLFQSLFAGSVQSLYKDNIIILIFPWVCFFITSVIAKIKFEQLQQKKKEQEAADKISREKNRIASEIAQEKRRIAEEKRKKEELINDIIALRHKSIESFERSTKSLQNAEGWLDRAVADFSERAFSPFWNSIEKAAHSLANFNANVREIESTISQYSCLANKAEGNVPYYPVDQQSLVRLDVGKTTADRMDKIVRRAQRDFEFESVFNQRKMVDEQRKTNKILAPRYFRWVGGKPTVEPCH